MQNSLTNTFLKGMNLDTAKEFVGTELYIYAQNVHVVSTDGTSGAMLPYIDVKTLTYPQGMDISEADYVLGTTDGYIQYNNDKTKCFIVLYKTKYDLYGLSVYVESTRVFHIETSTFDFEGNVKLINVWENSEVSRVYMCGKDSYIQVVNINGEYPEDVNNYDFSIFPRCGALPPLEFDEIVKGNKTAGKVLYAYQLFDENGKTTALSAISKMIPVGKELQGDLTDEGVSLLVAMPDTVKSFKYIRIFVLQYTKSTDIPRIYIKDELKLTTDEGYFKYHDVSDLYLSEISLEEFLSIKSAVFKASTIETKNNRLFAANITENVFDIDFDARVYSADAKGDVLINGKNERLINIVNKQTIIDETFVYNNPDPSVYKFNTAFGKVVNKIGIQTDEDEDDKVAYDILDKLSNVISTSEFNEYEIIDTDYVYGSYVYNEITDDGIAMCFPLSLVYFVDFTLHNATFNECFFGGLDTLNKKIYKIKAIDYQGTSLLAMYKEGTIYRSIATGIQYKLVIDDSLSFGKIQLLELQTPYVEVYPYGGSGPNVSYMFIRPVLYLAPDTSTDKYISRELSQNEYGEATYVTMLSDKTDDPNWTHLDKINKPSYISHNIKNVNYSDPYICANYTGFKLGESYTFGIIFYNEQNIPSPVHFIGTIHIPYFNHWIFGGVKESDKYHDLLATTVGIRFKIDLSDTNNISAYEIVRVQKTTDTRKILMQGIACNSVEYPKKIGSYGGESLGSLDLRCPMFPTISDKFISLFNTPTFYHSLQRNDPLETIGNYFVFVSPEISTIKENSQNITSFAKQLYRIGMLSSVLYKHDEFVNLIYREATDSDYGVTSLIRPLYKHLSYGVSTELDINTDGNDLAKYSGIPMVYYDALDNAYCEYLGISVSTEDTSIGHCLFKYYLPSDYTEDKTTDILSIKFCSTTPVDQLGLQSVQNAVVIGEKQFVNTTVQANKGDSSRSGLHCNCMIVKLSNDSILYERELESEIPMYHGWDVANNFKYVEYTDPLSDENAFTVDVKDENAHLGIIYNTTFTTRCTAVLSEIHSNYISDIRYNMLGGLQFVSTGCYTVVLANEQQQYINCFGGDTYVCIHKELWSGYGYGEFEENTLEGRNSIHIKYPVETRINLDRVAGPNFDSDPSNPFFTFEPSQLLEYGAQELPLNAYNDAYSAQEYNKVFVTKGAYDIEDQHIGNRIVASEVKSTGELSDSFLNFKTANYIDVDVDHGNITNLVKYNDRLYYLQSTAFGTVAVNERSLITDNNQAALLLGTGDVLTRYDNISTFDGSNVTNDPSIIISPSSMYWYDANKKLICVFNQGGVNSLSKIKQVLSYAKDMTNVHSGYDAKNNEVWFSNDTNSLIYNEQLLAFTGFYTTPVRFAQIMADHSIGLTKSNKLIQFGKTTDSTELSKCFVKFVVNKEPALPKVFDTMMVTDCGSITSYSDTPFDVDCTTIRQGDSYGNCIHNREGIYYVSIGRDLNKERMRDKTMTVLLTFEDTNFNVPFVNTIYRYSRI